MGTSLLCWSAWVGSKHAVQPHVRGRGPSLHHVDPAAGRVLAGPTWWRVGRFLGPNIEEFYRRWPMHRLFEAWREAGMVDVEDRVMSLGGGLVMWGRKHHA